MTTMNIDVTDCESWSDYRCYRREMFADESGEKYETWSKATQNEITVQVEAKISGQCLQYHL